MPPVAWVQWPVDKVVSVVEVATGIFGCWLFLRSSAHARGLLAVQVLAKKMTVLYKLASGQLSKQSHYDFGLRALKAVLVMAGELKRGSPELNEVGAAALLHRRTLSALGS